MMQTTNLEEHITWEWKESKTKAPAQLFSILDDNSAWQHNGKTKRHDLTLWSLGRSSRQVRTCQLHNVHSQWLNSPHPRHRMKEYSGSWKAELVDKTLSRQWWCLHWWAPKALQWHLWTVPHQNHRPAIAICCTHPPSQCTCCWCSRSAHQLDRALRHPRKQIHGACRMLVEANLK